MSVTTKYLHSLLKESGISHNKIVATMLTIKSRLPQFGNVIRRMEEHNNKLIPNYTVTNKQAVMIICSLKDESIIYLVRDLIRMEEKNSQMVGDKVSDVETDKFIEDSTNKNKFSDVGKVLSSQSASLDMVDVTKRALLSLTSDNMNRGVCSLYELKEMLSEATGKDLETRYVLSIIVAYTEYYKSRIIKHGGNKIFIPLDWISPYLDDIMVAILKDEKMNSEQSVIVNKYLGEPAC